MSNWRPEPPVIVRGVTGRAASRSEGVGAGLITASLFIRAGNWIAALLGLPGDISAWQSIAAVLGNRSVSVDPFFVRLFVADALLIVGCVLLGPTLFKVSKKLAKLWWETHKEKNRARRLFRWISEEDYQALRQLVEVGDIQLGQMGHGLKPFVAHVGYTGHESVWTFKPGMRRLARRLISQREKKRHEEQSAKQKAAPQPTTALAQSPPSSPESSESKSGTDTGCSARSEEPSPPEGSPASD